MKCRDCKSESEPDRSRCKKHLAKYREYSRVNQDRMRNLNLIRRYGIDSDQYDLMFDEQGGVCAICLKPETSYTGRYSGVNRLAVDHCHKTGMVRGLLCRRCNLILGKAEDDPETLRSAAEYLETSKDMGLYY